jgi:hypothetical protein
LIVVKRDVADIVDAVMAEMPAYLKGTFAFIQREAHSGFVPPECRPDILRAFTDLFIREVPNPPTEEWQFRAVAKLMNVSVDDVKLRFTPLSMMYVSGPRPTAPADLLAVAEKVIGIEPAAKTAKEG